MANKKVFANSNGIYILKDGKTHQLEKGVETEIDAKQADKLEARKKVTFVTNKK